MEKKSLLKRTVDVIGSLAGPILCAPLLLLTAAVIKLESRGAAFVVQERIGLDGKPFPQIKFRTKREDGQYTRVGRLLRCTYIDELPQLINVLLGHMSLVGPPLDSHRSGQER